MREIELTINVDKRFAENKNSKLSVYFYATHSISSGFTLVKSEGYPLYMLQLPEDSEFDLELGEEVYAKAYHDMTGGSTAKQLSCLAKLADTRYLLRHPSPAAFEDGFKIASLHKNYYTGKGIAPIFESQSLSDYSWPLKLNVAVTKHIEKFIIFTYSPDREFLVTRDIIGIQDDCDIASVYIHHVDDNILAK